ncbi:hypothetical protein D9Q98_008618 [Chlorella vulgaris]|uniref:DNA-directed primase/polymerase protein n=1 Tax=Chlorella vulgaris TaxID=3077 RepID=A0A9D4YUE3_CHLVU|nr:hypothetical protein D9Q98_008618 [Chlorella vulgaris]
MQQAGGGTCASQQQQQMEERVLRFLRGVQHRIQAAAEGAAPPAWHTFPTQQAAFDLADSEPGLEVYSVEQGPAGRRRFIATSRSEFWRRYRDMLPQHRHLYEIIRQGAPCHLYFDLEFVPAENPARDGVAAVDGLLSLVREQLRASFQLDMQDSWVLELDSSTEAKFSRHVVVRLPDAAFASNAHVGAFVLQLCSDARQRRHEDARCAALIVNKEGGEEALLVDTAVYTRNRAFRLYLSSKWGKQAVLESTSRFGGAGLTMQECFEAALVTNVPPEAGLLRCFEETAEEAAAATAGGASASAAAQLRSLARREASSASHVCYGPLPYTGLEDFVNSVCCEGGVQGRVRSWLRLEDPGQPPLLCINVQGNRFCGNIGRAHKSNGIFYVVDVRSGSWCQRCYDPDCRHYRSPLTPLPPHILALWQQHPPLPTTPAAATDVRQHQRYGNLPLRALVTEAASSEAADDSLMLQALEEYEQTGVLQPPAQQQVAQQQPAQQQAEQLQSADDHLLLQALLQYEAGTGQASGR